MGMPLVGQNINQIFQRQTVVATFGAWRLWLCCGRFLRVTLETGLPSNVRYFGVVSKSVQPTTACTFFGIKPACARMPITALNTRARDVKHTLTSVSTITSPENAPHISGSARERQGAPCKALLNEGSQTKQHHQSRIGQNQTLRLRNRWYSQNDSHQVDTRQGDPGDRCPYPLPWIQFL
jgi:hypothetical protein